MGEVQNLEANRRLLRSVESELELVRKGDGATIEKYVKSFPHKTREEIRELLIKAREADVRSFSHIIQVYEEKLGLRQKTAEEPVTTD